MVAVAVGQREIYSDAEIEQTGRGTGVTVTCSCRPLPRIAEGLTQ
jgi:hypothetical protein